MIFLNYYYYFHIFIIELNSLLCFFTKDPHLEAGSQMLLSVHLRGDICFQGTLAQQAHVL